MNAQTIAIVGLLTTAVVGLFAVVGPMVNARYDRQHRVELDRASARRSRREGAYIDFSAFLERLRLQLLRYEPLLQLFGPIPDPPGPLPDDEWMALSGRLRVSASTEAQEAISEAHKAANDFIVNMRRYQSHRAGAPVEPESSEDPNESPGMRMHNARQHAMKMIDDAQDLMNNEIDNL